MKSMQFPAFQLRIYLDRQGCGNIYILESSKASRKLKEDHLIDVRNQLAMATAERTQATKDHAITYSRALYRRTLPNEPADRLDFENAVHDAWLKGE